MPVRGHSDDSDSVEMRTNDSKKNLMPSCRQTSETRRTAGSICKGILGAARALAIIFILAGCGEKRTAENEQVNLPPEFISTAPTTARVYTRYFYQLSCRDPERQTLLLALGGGDTCGGVLTDFGNSVGTYEFTPEPDQANSECAVELFCMDEDLFARQAVSVSIEPPSDIEDLVFDEFVQWARPVDDYIDAAADALGHEGFFHAIHDMAVFENRLHFGYGDADLNVGRHLPIQVRYWEEEMPEAVQTDFTVNEEQISLFRRFGNTLIIPGVDATEDNLLGNVYTLKAGGWWFKSRTLSLGWHVHDVAVAGGAIFACGSGGTIDDYNNSTVNALLWRSDDGGRTFQMESQLPHPDPPGDHRLTNLLSVGGVLHAFGYYSTLNPSVSYGLHYELTENGLDPFTGTEDFFVFNTVYLSEDLGLLVGVKIQDPLAWGALLLTPSGVEAPPALQGKTILDAEPMGDGRTLLLYIDGDEYPVPGFETWTFHMALTNDGEGLTELLTQTADVRPVSVAFWRRGLFLGMDDGAVLRAQGADL